MVRKRRISRSICSRSTACIANCPGPSGPNGTAAIPEGTGTTWSAVTRAACTLATARALSNACFENSEKSIGQRICRIETTSASFPGGTGGGRGDRCGPD